MIKNFPFATACAVILWFFSFGMMTVMDYSMDNIRTDILMLLVNPLLILFVGWLYFRDMKDPKPSFLHGLSLGLYFVIIGSIIDLIIMVPLFFDMSFVGFYSQWTVWAGMGITLLFSGISGHLNRCKIKGECDNMA